MDASAVVEAVAEPVVEPDVRPGGLRVLVLVDDAFLGSRLTAALRTLRAVDAVRACPTAREAEGPLRSGSVDVLVGSGLDAGWLRSVREWTAAAATPLTVLAVIDDGALSGVAGESGTVRPLPAADGFLMRRGLDAAALGETLRRAVGGELPMPAALSRALLARAGSPYPGRGRTALTSRETETLRLMAGGLSNKQIARQLSISSHGAKRLVSNVLLKLDSPNRTTAVVNAMKAGIVP